ncbi:MAG: ABC transporter ATP-binding protein [Eubacteriales bacterium]|nr:ABC transporter ATP-binding protein [Eubacteriales bacterium]
MEDTLLLKVNSLSTQFVTKDGVLPAVDHISFDLQRGQVLGVVGESGCGKSVMSMSILKLIEKYGGTVLKGSSVLLEGRELLNLPEREMRNVRGREISMISQDPMTALNPVFTIGQQMVETLCRHKRMTRKQAKETAVEWLTRVGISEPEKRMKEYPHQLSGGMCQRVVIAMALSCHSKILIADEPTTALDVTIQAQILDLFREMKEQTGAAIILITHDMGVVADMADIIMVMYAGKAVEFGSKEQLFRKPRHPYTQGLLASVPRLDVQVETLYSIPGTVPNLKKPIKGCVFYDRCPKAERRCAESVPPQSVMKDGGTVACWLYAKAEETIDGRE